MSGSAPSAFRLILAGKADGRLNMAVDHALLDGMERPDALPVIRLYGFSPPTVSLGRFQKAREVLDVEAARRDGLIVVRRPTGGQAVLHDGEITYCVVLGRAHLQPFSKREVYRFVAGALRRALEGLGLEVVLAGERRGDLHNPDCFRTTGEYELTDGRANKLVGSAQLVTREGALQHGAIPLDESNRRISGYLRGNGADVTRDSTSIGALLGREASFDWAIEALARGLAEALPLRREPLREEETRQAERRMDALYSRDDWNLTP